jgi:hypothetical protein
MTPAEMKQARHALGLSLSQMARLLGYQGRSLDNLRNMQLDLETARRPIREPQRRLVCALLDGWRPADWEDITGRPASE